VETGKRAGKRSQKTGVRNGGWDVSQPLFLPPLAEQCVDHITGNDGYQYDEKLALEQRVKNGNAQCRSQKDRAAHRRRAAALGV